MVHFPGVTLLQLHLAASFVSLVAVVDLRLLAVVLAVLFLVVALASLHSSNT